MAGDALLDYTPFPSAGDNKRPAEESSSFSPDSKRPVGDEDAPPGTDSTTTTIIVPSIGKEDAEKAMKSIALPKEPKKQSQYVRFKSIMLKDAKARDDKETVKGITAAAKGAWNMVKHRSVQVEPLGSSITGPTPSESNSERFLS